MKVTFLIRALSVGGAERQLVTLAAGLAARGHRVSVLTFYPGALDAELAAAGVEVSSLGKRGRWDAVGFLARLARRVRDERPDVLHAYLAGANVLSALLAPLVRPARVVWGVRASDMKLERYDRLARALGLAERALSGAPSLIIANSHAGLEHAAANGFPRDRMVVVPNGIDAARFRPDPELGLRTRAEWGVPAGAPLVGLVGRLDPMKDHPTFLAAAARVAAERPDARFACVGDGDAAYGAEMRRLADRHGLAGRISWVPARAETREVYAALDALASSSAYGEGFSNVVAEAMACGVSCVVTDVGDSARIVADAGRVVRPGDARALAEAILAALDARDAAAPERLRARVVDDFSVERLVERTESVLRARALTEVLA